MQHQNAEITSELAGGMDVTVSEEGQLKLADDYPDCLNKSILRFEDQASLVYGSVRAITSEQINEIFGEFFFIGIFLFIIFMVGAVLIIHYKQISEGYEDHERKGRSRSKAD